MAENVGVAESAKANIKARTYVHTFRKLVVLLCPGRSYIRNAACLRTNILLMQFVSFQVPELLLLFLRRNRGPKTRSYPRERFLAAGIPQKRCMTADSLDGSPRQLGVG